MRKTEAPSPPSLQRQSIAFAQHRTLVLNADFSPMGFPLEFLNAEDTIHGLCLERFNTIYMSDVWAHSVSSAMQLPSVVTLKAYVPQASLHGVPNCNLENLYVRDRGICQYTGAALRMNTPNPDCMATMDHVIPQCRGGETAWNNVLLSSFTANGRKGSKTAQQAGYAPRVNPWVPSGADLLYLWLQGGDRLSNVPETWRQFLEQIKPSAKLERILESYAKAA